MNRSYEIEGKVSVFAGIFPDESAADAYLKEDWGQLDDDEMPFCAFWKDLGVRWIDHDFQEIHRSHEERPLEALLRNSSYAESFVGAVSDAGRKLGIGSARVAVLLFDHDFSNMEISPRNLVFVGAFPYNKPAQPMNEQASGDVIALVTRLVDAVQLASPRWRHAFLRIDAEEGATGAKCTYVDPAGVHFLDSMRHEVAYRDLIDIGEKLWAHTQTPERAFKVCLLIVNAHRKYELRFEYDDPQKWGMSKMDGGTGVPVGVTESDIAALGENLPLSRPNRPWYRFW